MPLPPPPDLSEWDRREPLTGDASPRRYSRLSRANGETAVLVEYPKLIRDQLPRDLEVFSWCRERGIRVPNLLAGDLETGCALIEDFGTTDAEAVLAARPAELRRVLLEQMLQPLEVLARCDPDHLPPWNPPLDRLRLRWELAGFELWYVHHFRSRNPTAALGHWLDGLSDAIGNHPVRVCHRDYHLNNLLIREDGAVGVIDVQDILVGPDTYDIVSLIAERAATRLIPEIERHSVLKVWANRTQAEPGWKERAAAVQIQRGLKVLGTFARFTVAGRSEYRQWLTELAREMVGSLEAAGAPPGVTAFLVD